MTTQRMKSIMQVTRPIVWIINAILQNRLSFIFMKEENIPDVACLINKYIAMIEEKETIYA